LFFRCRYELLYQGVAVGVFDVLQHLLTQRTFAERLQTLFQFVEVRCVPQACEAGSVGFQIPKGIVINDAHQAIECQERVLEWRSGQQHLGEGGHCLLDGVGDLTRGLIDVAQAMGFVDYHQIPRGLLQVRLFLARKLVRAEYDSLLLKRVEITSAHGVIEAAIL